MTLLRTDPLRWADITLNAHRIGPDDECAHCLRKYGEPRPWPCSYAERALEIRRAQA